MDRKFAKLDKKNSTKPTAIPSDICKNLIAEDMNRIEGNDYISISNNLESCGLNYKEQIVRDQTISSKVLCINYYLEILDLFVQLYNPDCM